MSTRRTLVDTAVNEDGSRVAKVYRQDGEYVVEYWVSGVLQAEPGSDGCYYTDCWLDALASAWYAVGVR